METVAKIAKYQFEEDLKCGDIILSIIITVPMTIASTCVGILLRRCLNKRQRLQETKKTTQTSLVVDKNTKNTYNIIRQNSY